MAKQKLPGFMTSAKPATVDAKRQKKVRELRDQAPPAVARGTHSRGEGRPVQVVIPEETLRALKQSALDRDLSVRGVILDALKKAGFPVPRAEITDRRRAG